MFQLETAPSLGHVAYSEALFCGELQYLREIKVWRERRDRLETKTSRRSHVNTNRATAVTVTVPTSTVADASTFPFFFFFFTSNCQCAACKSCFAWSAAQPAVRTNWLIMTWCLSSSIFDEARVLLAAAGSGADFQPFFLFLLSSCIPSLWLSRPPLQPVEQTQIFTVGAVVEGALRDWQEDAANHVRASLVGLVCCEWRVSGPCTFSSVARASFLIFTLKFNKCWLFVVSFSSCIIHV